MKKTLHKIIRKTPFIDYFGDLNKEVETIEYNSKKCKPNSCFVAIKGINQDGNKFIDDAIHNGAIAIITDEEIDKIKMKKNITYIFVDDSRKALADISHSFYDNPSFKLKVIGITGTNGKTTTTFILKSILEEAHKKVCIIGTTGIYINDTKLDSNLTTPESSDLAELFYELNLKNIEYVVMEVSSIALVMNRVRNIDFKVAAFLNLTQDHLDFHKTMENYVNAKKLLFDKLNYNAIAVVNDDSEFSNYIISQCGTNRIFKVGHNNNCEYKIIKEELENSGSKFLLYTNGKIIEATTNLYGTFNIENSAMAIAIADLLNISVSNIQKGLLKTTGAPGRMQKTILKNQAIGLVDYAHTPDALEKALLTCKNQLKNTNKLICVFGCGGNRDKTKRPLMGKIASDLSNYIILTNDNPRFEEPIQIIEDIKKGITDTSNVEVILDREKAIEKAIKISQKDDIILIAGKGHENYQIIGDKKIHFDDNEILKKYS